MDADQSAPAAPRDARRLRLRYAGMCVSCGTTLEKGTEALYHQATRTVRCIECMPVEGDVTIEAGSAGGSAHREYERRKAAREARVKSRLGDIIGGVALALTGEPQSTRAWERGSIGEQKLAEALAGIDGLAVLHDRRVRRTRGNIDHIIVGPAGVFVVDAKRYEGLIRIRDRGGFFKRDERLYVGSRDCSHLATDMEWQVAAVREVLLSAGVDLAVVPLIPVLCFVDGEWPMLLPPESYRGVRLEGKRSIKKLVGGRKLLASDQIERISRSLALAFPAK